MVSEKVIVVLIIAAILLSVVSIVVTLSTVNTKMIPKLNIKENIIPDVEEGEISIIVNPPEQPVYSPGSE